jgi:hypothetical protein
MSWSPLKADAVKVACLVVFAVTPTVIGTSPPSLSM